MLIAGLAKLVELVKKYAAPMYAPTAAGAEAARRVRASEKMTSSRSSVAMTSASRCATGGAVLGGDADRCRSEHAVGGDSSEGAAGDLSGHVGQRVAPGQSAEAGVDERDDRVEMGARYGTEHQNDREQPSGCRRGVLEQLEPDVARREALRGDPRADHHRGQKRRAEQLSQEPATESQAHDLP